MLLAVEERQLAAINARNNYLIASKTTNHNKPVKLLVHSRQHTILNSIVHSKYNMYCNTVTGLLLSM